MSEASVGILWTLEQDMFFGVQERVVWVHGVVLQMIWVGARAYDRVVCSLSKAYGVVGVKAVICGPSEDGGGYETTGGFRCSSDSGRGDIIRGGVTSDR